MFTASAHVYDLIYAGIKDYAHESSLIAALLRSRDPGCTSILDVACGTGEHARQLTALGFQVDGLDLNPELLSIARQKVPSARFLEADMSNFQLPHRYDAVLCLFSSIGYLVSLDRVSRAVRCFREHLAPRGVMMIEPWFPPGVLDPDRVVENVGEAKGVRVSRVSRVEVEGTVTRLHFEYEIIDASGSRRASEVHELGLFTTSELMQVFRNAGLDVEHDIEGLSGRGLFIARAPAQ